MVLSLISVVRNNFLQIKNLLTSKDTSVVVIKDVAITKYPVYRELQVFDFYLSGETLCGRSLAFSLTRE